MIHRFRNTNSQTRLNETKLNSKLKKKKLKQVRKSTSKNVAFFWTLRIANESNSDRILPYWNHQRIIGRVQNIALAPFHRLFILIFIISFGIENLMFVFVMKEYLSGGRGPQDAGYLLFPFHSSWFNDVYKRLDTYRSVSPMRIASHPWSYSLTPKYSIRKYLHQFWWIDWLWYFKWIHFEFSSMEQ